MKFEKPIPVKELAALMVDVRLTGNENILVGGFNDLHVVDKGDLTFVDVDKYYDRALNSAADVILVNKELPCPEGKCLIITPDPFANFNRLTQHFRPFTSCASAISPSAKIGEGTVVQPNCFIGNHVVIGKNCIIHANVVINDYSIIGDNVIIQSGAVIGGDACYFQRNKETGVFRKLESAGCVLIGNNVEIGALCAVDRGVSGKTSIGDGCKMDNFVQIGHDAHIGKNVLIGAHCAIAGVTTIEDDVTVWSGAMINKDLTIGKGAVILATSAVDKDCEPGKTYFGTPAVEARLKWREMAATRNLPELLERLSKK